MKKNNKNLSKVKFNLIFHFLLHKNVKLNKKLLKQTKMDGVNKDITSNKISSLVYVYLLYKSFPLGNKKVFFI